MNDRIIAHAALDTTDRILELIRNCIRDEERADAWREIYVQVKAGIEAAFVQMERQQERLKPGRN